MKNFELAQLNIAQLVAPLESAELADFVNNLDSINALAEDAPGFVWRLQTEEGDATAIKDFGDEFIVNMSVWVDVASLHNFAYKTAHAKIMSRRRQWFSRMTDAYSVLWWVKPGHRPTIAEAKQKLNTLRELGPTSDAFTFKRAFPPPTPSIQARDTLI